ncbi:ribose 5-phosphate isomerase B [Caminibacter pacificus]|uniref:Ribose 5-phosphate isomerase B n=1 Tax=Caminibacter pacificus TaxID=1424653 RepID=A0AAJ4UYU5_9BACT|nr:ribose 5-phosphate isomerase B [Caminibacter pacificus]NPA88057.1 ribose 5-phosphate isomerase B [Campylobacterota bacterium]QCI28227.1 ribose 5-phosphate isomerase B [Caminibacter pacificus]ROR41059.1 ribose 5-phosphate isomerase B [Caminibacter pacificus]
MKYFIGTDHAGFEVKPFVIEYLEKRGIEVEDLGTYSKESVDYPDYAHKVAEAVLANPGSMGILICGSGIGMSLAANKHKGIRAALCHDYYTAEMARRHNDANILCFGARIVGLGVIESILEAWLTHDFEGGRHLRRVEKIDI